MESSKMLDQGFSRRGLLRGVGKIAVGFTSLAAVASGVTLLPDVEG